MPWPFVFATPFWVVRNARQNFKIYFGPQHTRCKRNHGKIFIRFRVIIFLIYKWVWPCHALLSGPACTTKFLKIFWTTAYSMQKESWKNILNKKCVWPCNALLGGPACSTKFSKIFWTKAYSWKNIHPFSCNNFQNKKWAWSFHAPRDADRTSTMYLQTLLMLCISSYIIAKISNLIYLHT